MSKVKKSVKSKSKKNELIKRVTTAIILLVVVILLILPASYVNFGSQAQTNLDNYNNTFIKYDYFFISIIGLLLAYIIFEIVNFTSPFKDDKTIFWVNLIFLEIIFIIIYVFIAYYFIRDYNPIWAKPNDQIQDFGYNNQINNLLIYLISFSFIYLLINVGFDNEIKDSIINLTVSVLAFAFVLSILFLTIVFGFTVILMLILTTAFVDTFAYFGGKLFGNQKIFVNASPNKTFNGFLIGLLAGFLFFIFFYFTFVANMESSNLYWLNDENFLQIDSNTAYLISNLNLKISALMIVVIIISPFADAFFSKIKRNFNKKDFANILPGHGGVLDRLDSHIFTYTIFSFGLLFIVFI
ncbi:MAG: phosphatidate cytidylyltransferase [Candidatus Hepatoplasma scabrum]|nr:MAG: phosphatidate cytidylyltransferase [Candidatus Hepatoplasma sp.]